MQKLVGALRAVAILLILWGVLAVVALAFGVIPPGGTEPATPETEADAGPPDAGPDAADAAEATDAGTDAGAVDTGPAAPAPAETATTSVEAARYVACEAAVRRAHLRTVRVLGSGAPELVVGCGPQAHLVAVEPRDGAPSPVRVATLTTTNAVPGTTLEATSAAAGDVTGDGRPDLVLGFVRSAGAETRGGELYLAEASAAGGFGRTVQLAPVAAADIALADLDDTDGLEVVVINLGNVLARRPSEVWIFRGGASPVRLATRTTGIGGRALAVADLDRDGHADIAAISTEASQVDIWFGDGAGGLPRNRQLAVDHAATAVSTDLDGDGATDIVVAGTALAGIFAGGTDQVEARELPGPRSLTLSGAIDLDRDGRVDLVGLLSARPVWARQAQPLTFEEGSLALLEHAPLAVQEMVVDDLDGDGQPELALLGRGPGEDAPWELVVVDASTEPVAIQLAAETTPLPDAPLYLNVQLR